MNSSAAMWDDRSKVLRGQTGVPQLSKESGPVTSADGFPVLFPSKFNLCLMVFYT